MAMSIDAKTAPSMRRSALGKPLIAGFGERVVTACRRPWLGVR